MDRAWLEDRDVEFHKRQCQFLYAQLVFAQSTKSPYEAFVRDQIKRLISLGKVSEKDARAIEVDVRVELAETWAGLRDPLEKE